QLSFSYSSFFTFSLYLTLFKLWVLSVNSGTNSRWIGSIMSTSQCITSTSQAINRKRVFRGTSGRTSKIFGLYGLVFARTGRTFLLAHLLFLTVFNLNSASNSDCAVLMLLYYFLFHKNS